MNQRFERLISLIGEDYFKKIQNSKVCVVGLGGVGGTCALTLARCGVGSIIIMDFDKVQESNINRQLIAKVTNIGSFKTDVLEREIKEINPDCNVIKVTERFDSNSSLFDNQFDYLVDCIDSVNDKLLLIKTCQEKGISFISSMGTAKKLNPKSLEITKISKTSYDPLAKVIRRKMKELKIKDFQVLSSTEEPEPIETLGSYMPVTSTAGLLLADYVIKELIK